MSKCKFVRVDMQEIRSLWMLAFRQKIVFGSPNDVLRSILGMESKYSDDIREKDKKIRIDIEVYEELQKKAKQFNIPVKPLNRLIEMILQNEKDRDDQLPNEFARRSSSRPATR